MGPGSREFVKRMEVSIEPPCRKQYHITMIPGRTVPNLITFKTTHCHYSNEAAIVHVCRTQPRPPLKPQWKMQPRWSRWESFGIACCSKKRANLRSFRSGTSLWSVGKAGGKDIEVSSEIKQSFLRPKNKIQTKDST